MIEIPASVVVAIPVVMAMIPVVVPMIPMMLAVVVMAPVAVRLVMLIMHVGFIRPIMMRPIVMRPVVMGLVVMVLMMRLVVMRCVGFVRPFFLRLDRCLRRILALRRGRGCRRRRAPIASFRQQ